MAVYATGDRKVKGSSLASASLIPEASIVDVHLRAPLSL